MTAARTVYDEVREQRAVHLDFLPRLHSEDGTSLYQWRAWRAVNENAVQQTHLFPGRRPDKLRRECLVRIAALAVAQIEALDRRTGAKL